MVVHRLRLTTAAAVMQTAAVRSVVQRSTDFSLLSGGRNRFFFRSWQAGGRRAHSNVSARPEPPAKEDDDKSVWYSEAHLKVLGLTQGASKRDIKRAYLRLVKELHPDRRHLQDEHQKAAAQEEFIAVQEAFAKLMGRREHSPDHGFNYDRNPFTEDHPVWMYMGGCIVIGTVLFFVVVQWWNSGVSDGNTVNKEILRHQERGTQDRKKRLQQALDES